MDGLTHRVPGLEVVGVKLGRVPEHLEPAVLLVGAQIEGRQDLGDQDLGVQVLGLHQVHVSAGGEEPSPEKLFADGLRARDEHRAPPEGEQLADGVVPRHGDHYVGLRVPAREIGLEV